MHKHILEFGPRSQQKQQAKQESFTAKPEGLSVLRKPDLRVSCTTSFSFAPKVNYV